MAQHSGLRGLCKTESREVWLTPKCDGSCADQDFTGSETVHHTLSSLGSDYADPKKYAGPIVLQAKKLGRQCAIGFLMHLHLERSLARLCDDRVRFVYDAGLGAIFALPSAD